MKDKFKSKLITHLARQSHAFEKQLLNIHRHPDRKKVHQLRITIRKIRAALWVSEHGAPHLSFGKLHADLRKLSRTLGSLREFDVALQDARHFHLEAKKLRKNRQAARRVLSKRTNLKSQKKLVVRLQRAIVKLQKHQEQTVVPGLALLRKRISVWTKKPLAAENDFHRLRIIAKKTRYTLEAIGEPAEPLRKLQNVLGKGHDFEVLQRFAKENPQVRKAVEAQYQRALPLVQPALRFAINRLPPVLQAK